MKTMLKRYDKPQEPKNVLSGMEAAKYMGVSYRIFTEILNSGELAHRRIGRRILISKDAITDWLVFRQTPAAGQMATPVTPQK